MTSVFDTSAFGATCGFDNNSPHSDFDATMMYWALDLARQGANHGEVPVGAVIVHENDVLATGFNCPIMSCDPTAHAEIVAIRHACQYVTNYRLPAKCTLYVTLEPCTMCLGAIIHARIDRLVFGAYEPKAGVIQSQENFDDKRYFNHTLSITGGVLGDECGQILREFFKNKRTLQKACKH